ncbi:MAG: hypothetical protein EA394_11490 [Bacteroidia bacterium]|nr:MAG: hypothetical protein EA394_11490 [Bacteroidia bacterium]
MLVKGIVLIVDPVHPLLMEELKAVGFECVCEPEIPFDVFMERLPHLTGIIIRSRWKLDKKVLQNAGKLRFVGRIGSGLENIDVDYARKKNIVCLNTPEGNRQSVGEHAAGMLLTLVNKICSADREVRQGIWQREKNWGTEIHGKTLGIIGYGNTGSAFAECMKGFGMEILVYDKYKTGFGSDHVREVTQNEIFKRADVLSLHVPLTDETHHLVNSRYLAKFQKPVYLINTARGAVVSTDDLLEAIDNGKVLGAALDVLEYERFSFEQLDFEQLPGSFRRLAQLPEVVLTPHVAGWTNESYMKLSKVMAEKIKRLFAGG